MAKKPISKKILKMMDDSVKNMAKGKVGKPLQSIKRDGNDYQFLTSRGNVTVLDFSEKNEHYQKITKKKLRAHLKDRGWPLKEINEAMKELWPDNI